MRHPWKQVAAIGFLVFLVLWVTAAVSGYSMSVPLPRRFDSPPPSHLYLRTDSNASRQQGLQMANNLKQLGLARMPAHIVLDQADVDKIRIHEKSAHLVTGTANFNADEADLRAALAGKQAIAINETAGGIEPQRRLTLEVGVHPDKFDALIERLREIGHLESVSVQQTDRTGEFRQLHSRRQSLKKHLESVRKLSARDNPTIDDALKLEQKIQDIEREMQSLSVQGGDFLGKESTYNVFVTLVEYPPGGRLDLGPTLVRRVGNAFVWALAWWCVLAVVVATGSGTYLSVRTLVAAKENSGAAPPT